MAEIGISSIFARLSDERAREVSNQLAHPIHPIDDANGGVFVWAKAQDDSGRTLAVLPRLLGLLSDEELHTIALSWNIDIDPDLRRYDVMTKLLAQAVAEEGLKPGA